MLLASEIYMQKAFCLMARSPVNIHKISSREIYSGEQVSSASRRLNRLCTRRDRTLCLMLDGKKRVNQTKSTLAVSITGTGDRNRAHSMRACHRNF
jgi:hypothetical protein